MKTQNLLMAAFCILISVSCGPRTDKEYLSDVLQKMNKVESVSYKVVRQAWLPGEKDPVYYGSERSMTGMNFTSPRAWSFRS